MTVSNLQGLKKSLEATLEDVNTLLEKQQPVQVLTQNDEGYYTEGGQVKDIVFLESQISEENELLLNFYNEKL